ncbi:hypothetical protein D7217_13550 [Legionella pneumophila]|uniref:hypothetical protein n=1 Tax=Legionella pneumophila TaxID=446 RepID=UPI0004806E97|nr:hypothetical protein [Legionella pneumophila]RYW87490.1 hypothetical protein D7217_13550 [Legionella pneumophila]STX99785.1 Uncharacterised protein [Legionella pneumophila]HAT1775538.1 hypothetical protein [Legionella pneumophila]HAT1779338.1 hypothetical protein [Legionella pneumophila]HAT2019663.1 hypothetical protein [Legionella pneumophila]
MLSKKETLISNRSVINHDHLITDETHMIGIYREGGDLSIYAESPEGIEHFSINRGNSLDMVILPHTLVGTWRHHQLLRTVEQAAQIRALRIRSHDYIEQSVTRKELEQFKEVFMLACKEEISNQPEIEEYLQTALGKLHGEPEMTYKPKFTEQCSIL